MRNFLIGDQNEQDFQIIVLLTFIGLGVNGPALAQQADALPLAEKGPYPVGTHTLIFSDESRDAREIRAAVWYPALEDGKDAIPDKSDGPYPVIIYSHGYGGSNQDLSLVTRHLASYGFVVVAAMHHDNVDRFMIDRPLDIVFTIHQIRELPADILTGLFDWDHLGVMGWSMGTTTALQMGGVRMDWPATQEKGCEYHPDSMRCRTLEFSEEFIAVWEQFGTTDENGLWYVPNDLDVDAIVSMAGGLFGLFGERGFAAGTVPLLILHGTADTDNSDYKHEAIYAYRHYGWPDRTLVSFIGSGHYFPQADPLVAPILVAFFGYHLQGHEDYAQYLTEAYINSIDRLAWGPYGMETSMLGTVPITPENAGQLAEIAVLPDADGIDFAYTFSVVWSPDGHLIAGGSGDRVNLWDAATGELLAELDGQIGSVNSVAFSPDGTVIAAAGGRYEPIQRGVQLWDVATHEPLLRLEDFDDTVFSVAFSPDGKTLLTGGGEPWGFGPGSAQLWDVITGELLHEFGLPNQYHPSTMMTVYNIAFNADGTLAAAIMGDGRVQVCEADTGTERVVLIGHEGWGNSVAFSPDGTLLATASAANFNDQGGDARLWDVTTGKQVATLEGHTGPVKSITFSPDGRMVASASADGTVRLWDTATAQVQAVLDVPGAYGVAFSPDGTTLATDGWDGVNTIRLWAVPG